MRRGRGSRRREVRGVDTVAQHATVKTVVGVKEEPEDDGFADRFPEEPALAAGDQR
jgi:hypothetical protein